MTCQAMHLWTFSGLVGAFLDLSIAFLLLWASTLAYIASKFLGFLGLRLPCPCNGLFGIPNGSLCLQRLLVSCPTEKVSGVQFSVKSKFPFDSILGNHQNCDFNRELITEGNYINELTLMEGEASSSLMSYSTNTIDTTRREMDPGIDKSVESGIISSSGVKDGRLYNNKGKGMTDQTPKVGIRLGRKYSLDYEQLSYADVQGDPPESSSSISKRESSIEDSSVPGDSVVDANFVQDEEEASMMLRMGKRTLSGEEIMKNLQREWLDDSGENKVIRELEQALEEEHAARAALYLELEKERNAASTAADEAMAMILRLQEEKASIEMEARQYQRIIEEKSAYDEEEMNILKEILVRREREKHFLEKEVEEFRQMLYAGNEESDEVIEDLLEMRGLQFPSSYNESIHKNEMEKYSSEIEAISTNKQNATLASGSDLLVLGGDGDANLSNLGALSEQFLHISTGNGDRKSKIQENEMFSMDSIPHTQPNEGQRVGTFEKTIPPVVEEKTIPQVAEEQEDNDNVYLHDVKEKITPDSCYRTEIYISKDYENLKDHEKDVYWESKDQTHVLSDKELCVHDVHVVNDKSILCNEVSYSKNDQHLENSSFSIPSANELPPETSETRSLDILSDFPSSSQLDSGLDINRSFETFSGLPPTGSKNLSFPSELRRNSLSALDSERSKIDYEVGWLRKRLQIVQEGREKLSLSVEHREKEKVQLQLLEDIACQLQEIRQLTEPDKAVYRASLPPRTSKVTTKKRRRRSASISSPGSI